MFEQPLTFSLSADKTHDAPEEAQAVEPPSHALRSPNLSMDRANELHLGTSRGFRHLEPTFMQSFSILNNSLPCLELQFGFLDLLV